MSSSAVPWPVPKQHLRLWPGILLVTLQWVLRFLVPLVLPDALYVGVIGGVVLGLGVLIWWAFFSRAPKLERFGGLAITVAIAAAMRPLLHESMATGMMGLLFPIYLMPILSLGLVLWAVLTQSLPNAARRIAMPIAVLLACGPFTLLRTEGMTGSAGSEFAWRWSQTKEEQVLAKVAHPVAPPTSTPTPAPVPVTTPPPAPDATPAPIAIARDIVIPEWPGFRGPARDGIVTPISIGTDWTKDKPVELWRKPVGPGWSSFSIASDRLYTQEQRGEEEIISCYNVNTGLPIWIHHDKARFWESNAGAGPRATPTLHEGRVYAFGATGILNALDTLTGAPIWSRNVATDTKTEVPGWGFSSSPLIVGDNVIVAATGQLAAYDRTTGEPRWQGPKSGGGYSSPHLFSAAGMTQVVLQSGQAAYALDPRDGKLLWKYEWPNNGPIVQPANIGNDLLVTSGQGAGMQRLAITRAGDQWKVEQRWTTNALKPYFNDYVPHNGHVYGFDNAILACIDATTGERKWKGGRYGNGQLILLREQSLLLILSEEGEIALVKATPDQFTEVARMPVLEGKTWNHPVIAGDKLFLRNATEMVALKLPTP